MYIHGIYHVYTGSGYIHGIYMVYTWYIPCIIFIGVPDGTYFGKKVCTRYKPVYVRLYRYHTIAWYVQLVTIPDVFNRLIIT